MGGGRPALHDAHVHDRRSCELHLERASGNSLDWRVHWASVDVDPEIESKCKAKYSLKIKEVHIFCGSVANLDTPLLQRQRPS